MDDFDLDLSFHNHELSRWLVSFRNDYDAANDEQRKQAREFVAQLAEIAYEKTLMPALPVRDILLVRYENCTRVDEEEAIHMPVRLLARAMEAWDRGECYPPTFETQLGDL